jgi:hypothetical protein
MVAITYTATRYAVPAKASAQQRKGLFARIVDALAEARMEAARREIARHAHLLPHDLELYGNRLTPRTEDQLPFGRR